MQRGSGVVTNLHLHPAVEGTVEGTRRAGAAGAPARSVGSGGTERLTQGGCAAGRCVLRLASPTPLRQTHAHPRRSDPDGYTCIRGHVTRRLGCAAASRQSHSLRRTLMISPSRRSSRQRAHWIPQRQHLRLLLQHIPHLLVHHARVDDGLVAELVHPLIAHHEIPVVASHVRP